MTTNLIKTWNLDFTRDRRRNTHRFLRAQVGEWNVNRGRGSKWIKRLERGRVGAIDLGFAILYP